MDYKQLNKTAEKIDEVLEAADIDLLQLGTNKMLLGGVDGKAIRVNVSTYMGDPTLVMQSLENITLQEGEHNYAHALGTKHFTIDVYDSAGKTINPKLNARSASNVTLYSSRQHLNANILLIGKLSGLPE